MNLVSHTNKEHKSQVDAANAKLAAGKTEEGPGAGKPGTSAYSGASRSVMDKFREEGLLNPKHEPTRRGFILMLAAWIMDDDLPFTTCTSNQTEASPYDTYACPTCLGESERLRRVFQYIKCKFELPSDTTLRNAVAQIIIQLHDELVKTMTVCSFLNFFTRALHFPYYHSMIS